MDICDQINEISFDFSVNDQGSSPIKGPRTYLARVSKEVKFHFRSTEFPQ